MSLRDRSFSRADVPPAATAVSWAHILWNKAPYLNLHISVSSLPQFGQSNVQSSWPGLALAEAMRASIMRVPQRGQSGLLIESEYVVLGLYVVTVRPHAHAIAPDHRGLERFKCTGRARCLGPHFVKLVEPLAS